MNSRFRRKDQTLTDTTAATAPRSMAMMALALQAVLYLAGVAPLHAAQAGTAKPGGAVHLDVAAGTKVTYRVREQLAGLSFPDDAIGSTDAVAGAFVIQPDGSINPAQSKLTIDLRQLKSDQEMRDGYVKGRTLQVEKFPTAEFSPKQIRGLPTALPANEKPLDQSSFELVGDLTVHGVTKEVTLTGYATYSRDLIAGHAVTNFTFATFGLEKPQLARLLSVDDKIQLELDFKMKRSN